MLNKTFFEQCVEFFNEEDKAQIESGNFPIVLAQNGTLTKIYVSEEDLAKYEHFDISETTKLEQFEIHQSAPIVWECKLGIEAVGIEPTPQEESTEEQ